MSASDSFQSWGLYPKAKQTAVSLDWLKNLSFPNVGTSVLPYGAGRSYGDCCLNDQATIISTRNLDRFISFNAETGLLKAEAGVTLAQILEAFVGRGWFLPVTPGTKFVTLGGAIANDVHGKNHHTAGTFGNFVERFEILRSSGERLTCSRKENAELFKATIAGIGLTGLITWAEIKLKPIAGPLIDMQSIKFANLDEFFEISASSDKDYEYTVAWIDCLASGAQLGRGIFMRGGHSTTRAPASYRRPLFNMPINAPNFALNKFSIQAFNYLYYNKQSKKQVNTRVHYDPFFYPLDALGAWNKIYGSRGFFQFQCVVKERSAITQILQMIAKAGQGSFLAVLKEFGDVKSDGLLSFPRKGFTLALDFPNNGSKTLRLLKELEGLVIESAGAMYPAKDACMSPASFRQFYPKLDQFKQFIDPKFSSSFWRRVTGT